MSVNQRASACLLGAIKSILICVLVWVEQASKLDIWWLLVLLMVTYYNPDLSVPRRCKSSRIHQHIRHEEEKREQQSSGCIKLGSSVVVIMFIGESTYVCSLVFDGEDEGNKWKELYFAFRR